MDTNARGRYVAPKKRRRRRRRRNSGEIANVLLLLLAVGLLFSSGRMFQKGMQDNPGTASSDGTAPVIQGVADMTVYAGDTVSYLKGVTAVDETDPKPTVTVDSSAVDLETAGNYTVTYIAMDAAGNECRLEAQVTVLPKKDGYVDLATISAAVEEKLNAILPQGGDEETWVRAIYAWARMNLHYGGHSDRDDWRQTAYGMLTEGTGDCFGYFAVTKLMFEQLGIPNIDVRKVKNSADDSDHFWSMVSVDGEQTWYHFDATPRVGDGDDFCLVTDAFLDAYSDSHNGSHNRDKSLYPATP